MSYGQLLATPSPSPLPLEGGEPACRQAGIKVRGIELMRKKTLEMQFSIVWPDQ
jgi:hypothetical protein